SIVGVEWIHALNKKYKTSIKTTKIYQYPTLSTFADYFYDILTKTEEYFTKEEDEKPQLKSEERDQEYSIERTINNSGMTKEKLLKELSESLAEELYMEEEDIDLEKSFIELGLDSIVGVEWIHALNKKYKTSIKTTKIYQYPTLREFTTYMFDELNRINKNLESSLQEKDEIDKLLWQIYQGEMDIHNAEELLSISKKEG
ncbi:phosphopantetheine-binding protein, partial [Niallia sp. HCP3S3_B10]|uniref:phosphopantetheine-binding protein n=1 Tax=Niallia sp. HCP3S3_B10 TaxID=3438944 RepID=UPI003F88ED14